MKLKYILKKFFKMCAFIFVLVIFSCTVEQGGQKNLYARYAGSLQINLQSSVGQTVGFSLMPQCADPHNYLICEINILNQNHPISTTPVVFQWFRAATCSEYYELPLMVNDIPCLYACTDHCVAILVDCINTNSGTSLSIAERPENVSCQ